jgi:hypothetical protein
MSPITSKPILHVGTQEFAGTGPWTGGGEELDVTGAFQNDSTRNGWYHKQHGGSDIGSIWTALKSEVSLSHPHVEVVSDLWFADPAGYRGGLMIHEYPHFDWGDFVALANEGNRASEMDFLSLGASAIAETLPTNPISDLPTGIGELLTEGLPSTIGSRIRNGGGISASNIGDEYLNGIFGWLPFYRDMENFAYAASNANALLAQYALNSGKPIRRRRELGTETIDDVVEHDNNAGYARYLQPFALSVIGSYTTPAYGGWSGVREDRTTVSTRRWFSAAYTYFLPELGIHPLSQLQRDIAEAKYLYGGISASTVWNLLPYSWAVDWFTNAGDLIRNLDAFLDDGLVIQWGYIMEKHSVTQRRTVRGASIDGGGSLPSTITSDYTVTLQRRRKATPFGFGVDMGSLTPRQLSILGALGASRF